MSDDLDYLRDDPSLPVPAGVRHPLKRPPKPITLVDDAGESHTFHPNADGVITIPPGRWFREPVPVLEAIVWNAGDQRWVTPDGDRHVWVHEAAQRLIERAGD